MAESVAIFFFFFNDTATTEIYTLSLHDALPIFPSAFRRCGERWSSSISGPPGAPPAWPRPSIWSASTKSMRSEEHTSELQSQSNLVCRLLLEKKKKITLAKNTHTDFSLV